MKFIYIALVAILAFQAVSARPAEDNRSWYEKLYGKMRDMYNSAKDYVKKAFNQIEQKYVEYTNAIERYFNDLKGKVKSALDKADGIAKENWQKLYNQIEVLQVKGAELAENYKEKVKEYINQSVEDVKIKYEELKVVYEKNKACAEKVRPDIEKFFDKYAEKSNQCGKIAENTVEELYNKSKDQFMNIWTKIENAVKKFLKDGSSDEINEIGQYVDEIVSQGEGDLDASQASFKQCVTDVYNGATNEANEIKEKINSYC